ncbi:reverse transcriptase domain-containing protein [Tanacetum coccineum]
MNLLQLVQANPFYGRENDNPHAHINSFKRITSTLRFRNVPNDVIKLMMFPYSLEGAAKTCEAWERFKELLRACPHHGFTELTQVDTFYNGLNDNEQDSLNAAAGGNLLSKTTREALNIIENKSKVRYSRNKPNASRMNVTSSKTDERIDKLADQLSTLVEIVSKKVVTPAPVKAVEESCVTCGGAHAWYNCPATDNNQASVCATTGTYNQVNPPNRVSNQMAPPGFALVQNNGQNRFNQNQGQGNNFNRGNNFQGNQSFQSQVNHASNFQNQPFQVPHNQVQDFLNEFSSYKKSNNQTIRNLQYQITSMKGELKNEIQNTIKSQQNALMSQNNAFQNTLQNNLQNMLSGFFQTQASTSGTLPSNTVPNPKGEMKTSTTRSGIAYEGPSIPTNPSPKKVVERETQETTDKEQTNFQGSTAQIPPSVIPIFIPKPDVSTTLPKTTPIPEYDISKNLPNPKSYIQSRTINLMPLSIWKKLSLPELTPTRMTLELADRSITYPKGLAEDVFVKVGKFHFPTDFVVVDFEVDPRVPLILGRSFLRTGRALIDVYGEEITLRVDNEAYAPEFLGFPNSSVGNLTPTSEPFTSEFILEEIKAYLKDDSISPEIDHADCNPEEDICHKISKSGIEVDRAKVDVIAKLPHPTTVKGVRSFLGHAGPFPSSRGNKYILVVVDYLSKWVKAKALLTNDARVVVKFLKSLFARFGTPRAIISDRGTHICNDQFAKDTDFTLHSRLKIFSPKSLKLLDKTLSTNTIVYPYGTIELSQPDGPNFKVAAMQNSPRKQSKPDKHEHGNGRAHKEPGDAYQKSTMVNSSQLSIAHLSFLYIPPSIDRRDDIPESEQPPRKRLCLSTLGSRYKIGESSTARPTRGWGIDYEFVSMVDAEKRRQGVRDVGYGIRDTWIDPVETVPEVAPMTVGEVNTRVTELVEVHEHDTQNLYALLEDAQDSRSHISQRVDMDSQRMQQAEIAALRESDRRRQAQMAETLRVMRDMRQEMIDMQAELAH